jgi:small conductance mechanosensitive channel
MLFDILPVDSLNVVKAEAAVSSLDKIVDQLLDTSVSLGIKIVTAIIIFSIGRWLIGWLRKFLDKVLLRRNIEETVRSFLDSVINITLKILLFILIANVLGFQTTSFAAILAAAGLAVGMAMKGNLSNFAGGVLLLINKPFKIGDRVVAQGTDGIVQSIGILYTVLLTGDNITIYVPNGPLSTGNITNYSAQEERRIDLTFNISYGADLDVVKDTLKNVIQEDKQIKDTPIPFIGVTHIDNGSISITIRVWVNSNDYTGASVNLNERIYKSLSEKRIVSASTLSVKMIND